MRADGPHPVGRGRDDAGRGDAPPFGFALDLFARQGQGRQGAARLTNRHPVAATAQAFDMPKTHSAASSVPRKPPDCRFQ